MWPKLQVVKICCEIAFIWPKCGQWHFPTVFFYYFCDKKFKYRKKVDRIGFLLVVWCWPPEILHWLWTRLIHIVKLEFLTIFRYLFHFSRKYKFHQKVLAKIEILDTSGIFRDWNPNLKTLNFVENWNFREKLKWSS